LTYTFDIFCPHLRSAAARPIGEKYAKFRTFAIEGVQTLAQCKADRVFGI